MCMLSVVLFSVAQLCRTLWDCVDCSMPGFPVLHNLPEFAQTHVHWISDAIQSSVIPIFTCPQSFPASGSFPMNQLFVSGGQNIWPLASVLPMHIQGWFLFGLTGLISLLSKGVSRVFSSPTVRKHRFLGAQPFLWSNSHIYTWLTSIHSFDYTDLCQQIDVSVFLKCSLGLS